MKICVAGQGAFGQKHLDALKRIPDVEVTSNGQKQAYRAVVVDGAEHERVNSTNPLPLAFRFLTGFPERLFLRLDPREAAAAPQ